MWNRDAGCSVPISEWCFFLTWWTPHTFPPAERFLPWHLIYLVPCLQGCFFHILSLLPRAAVVQQLFPLEDVIRGTPTFTDELGPGQQWVSLGAGWYWLHWTWGKASRSFPQKPPLWSPSTKTLPHKRNAIYVSLAFKRYRLSFFWQIDQRLPLKRMG